MAQIKVEITIPEEEYKSWYEFQEEGVVGCMLSIKSDLIKRLQQDYVRDFYIEVSNEE